MIGKKADSSAEVLSQRSKAFQEFKSEVYAMAALQHPNVVRLVGVCLDPVAMVMEVIGGGDLYFQLNDPFGLQGKVFFFLDEVKAAVSIFNQASTIFSKAPFRYAFENLKGPLREPFLSRCFEVLQSHRDSLGGRWQMDMIDRSPEQMISSKLSGGGHDWPPLIDLSSRSLSDFYGIPEGAISPPVIQRLEEIADGAIAKARGCFDAWERVAKTAGIDGEVAAISASFFEAISLFHEKKGADSSARSVDRIADDLLATATNHARILAPVEMPLRLKLACDVVRGLNHLHELQPPMVHRDLKTPNIFLVRSLVSLPLDHDQTSRDSVWGTPLAKVGDFGLSVSILSGGALQIRDRDEEDPLLKINATWAAPEVLAGEPYTTQADVYAVGIMLWELAARAHPFSEYSQDFLKGYVLEGARPSFDECLQKDPSLAPFAALATACWARDPSLRPSARSVYNSLRDIATASASFLVPFLPDLPALLHHEHHDHHNSQHGLLQISRHQISDQNATSHHLHSQLNAEEPAESDEDMILVPDPALQIPDIIRHSFCAQQRQLSLDMLGKPLLWVQGKHYRDCPACKRPFTLLTRRHHCRLCGGVFCGDCSRYKRPIPAPYSSNSHRPMRVCSYCEFQFRRACESEPEQRSGSQWLTSPASPVIDSLDPFQRKSVSCMAGLKLSSDEYVWLGFNSGHVAGCLLFPSYNRLQPQLCSEGDAHHARVNCLLVAEHKISIWTGSADGSLKVWSSDLTNRYDHILEVTSMRGSLRYQTISGGKSSKLSSAWFELEQGRLGWGPERHFPLTRHVECPLEIDEVTLDADKQAISMSLHTTEVIRLFPFDPESGSRLQEWFWMLRRLGNLARSRVSGLIQLAHHDLEYSVDSLVAFDHNVWCLTSDGTLREFGLSSSAESHGMDKRIALNELRRVSLHNNISDGNDLPTVSHFLRVSATELWCAAGSSWVTVDVSASTPVPEWSAFPPDLSSDPITALLPVFLDSQSFACEVWACHRSSRISRWAPGTGSKAPPLVLATSESGQFDARWTCMAQVNDHQVWLGTSSGDLLAFDASMAGLSVIPFSLQPLPASAHDCHLSQVVSLFSSWKRGSSASASVVYSVADLDLRRFVWTL